jgi:ribosome-associated protein
MIPILPGLAIPLNEISFSASRSGGPGGQNVNKVSTKVTLAFDVAASMTLSNEQKKTIRMKLGTRINKDGVLQIASQRTRSQELNRTDAIERFAELVRRALTPKRARVKTRVPAGAKERRLDEKKKHSMTKASRSDKKFD